MKNLRGGRDKARAFLKKNIVFLIRTLVESLHDGAGTDENKHSIKFRSSGAKDSPADGVS